MGATVVKVDTTRLRELNDRVLALGGLTLRVGIVGPGASTLEAGSSLTLAELGLLHEFGAPGADIPERSWLRSALAARRADIAALKVATFKRVLAGELQPRAALDLIGMQLVAWIKAGIVAGIKPDLATETILRKGSTKPLIDDGQFINSITWIVEETAPKAAA